MKKLLLLLSVFASVAVFAQNQKFGHINSSELVEIMPQRDSIDNVLQSEIKQMEQTMSGLETELKMKYQEFMVKQDSLSNFMKQKYQQDLQELDQKIQAFQAEAQKEIQQRQAELYNPLMELARKAIDDVGKESGFLYIFDVSSGVVLYQSDKSVDVMPLVKKKLGIKE